MSDDTEEIYHVKIIRRDFNGRARDDYHATVTRVSDGEQLVFISGFRWWLKFRTRRKGLEREYRYQERRKKKLAKTDEFSR